VIDVNALQIERISQVAQQAMSAKHGERGNLYEAVCAELGISIQTLHRVLNKISVRPPRKQRSTAGKTALTLAEAKTIAAYLLEHIRKNNKKTKSLEQAIAELRANGLILAGVIDDDGVVKYLSISAISRALVGHGVHLEQLLAPDPVTPQSSEHPNDVWQLDASLCVLYKLPDTGYGIEEVKTVDRYKNKLSHFAKIEHKLVQRYVITDHASCALFIYFAFGGETTESVCDLLISAIRQRGSYPFYGIPNILMVDRGSANRSAMFRNLCKALGIRLIITQGARAKGQVEKMHDVVESGLESGLKMAIHIRTVEQLNNLGNQWAHWFNGTAIHSRHGKTRYSAWQLIKSEQLKVTNLSAEQLVMLARETPVSKKVTDYLTVNFKGAEFDVSQVPLVMVGQKLMICRCGFKAGFAQAVLVDENGNDIFYSLPEKTRSGDFGFYDDAAKIGDEFKRHTDTPAQTARKELERLVMSAGTDKEAEDKRKAKFTPFGGAVDPYKAMKEYEHPAYMPKRSTPALVDQVPVVAARKTIAQGAAWLKQQLGGAYDKSIYAQLQKQFPEGVTEEELEQVIVELTAGRTVAGTAKLRAV